MSFDEDKKTINQIPVDTHTHRWLVRFANLKGESLKEATGSLLDMLYTAYIPETDQLNKEGYDNEQVELFWSWFKFKQKEIRRQRVFQAAAIYASDPTEENADMLARMCELARLDYAEVKEKAENDPYSSLIASTRNGTKFGECMRWLPQFIMEQGGQVNVAPLRAMANRQGFTASMLDRVKRAIQNDPDAPAIVSVKVGAAWAWRIELELQEID